MSTIHSKSAALGISIDVEDSVPAYLQIFTQVRSFILSGRLEPDERLPSTRMFAEELGVSRTTLVTAYDHLLSEGYIYARRGAGMFVATYSPEQLLTVTHGDTAHEIAGKMPTTPVSPAKPIRVSKAAPFQITAREKASFPHVQWARLLQKHWRHPPDDILGIPDPAGDRSLREAICEHLRVWRGLYCSAEQIFISSGGPDAANAVLRCIAYKGAMAFLEDPGYAGTRRVVEECGLDIIYQPVDGEGMVPPVSGNVYSPGAFAAVTPSRQFPLGLTMSLSRRLELIDWAARSGGWIIEDDYDSEFRYVGRPLAAMMSLDETGRVIYIGSFSSSMFKGLRLGFSVMPLSLVDVMRASMQRRGTNAANVAQAALAEFIASGQFATHARRLRRLYGRRRAVLLEAINETCIDYLQPENTPAGMSMLVTLKPGPALELGDKTLSKQLASAGIYTMPLSAYYASLPSRQGLVLGFAGFDEDVLRSGVDKLAQALRI